MPSESDRQVPMQAKVSVCRWVTCVTYLSNGCILSGGMDSNLCLWTKSGSKCHTLKGMHPCTL